MKLLSASHKANIWVTLITLVISGISLFFILRALVLEEIDEQLMLQASRIEKRIEQNDLPNDPAVQIKVLEERGEPQWLFQDTLIFVEEEGEKEVYRKLTKISEINGASFQIEIVTSRLEWEDMIQIIFVVFITTVALILLAGMWINYRVSRRIWAPFFANLERIRRFSFEEGRDSLILVDSAVDEFTELNDSVTYMGLKLQKDYKHLKEFTENASHELQTPLAVITSKLDQIDQSKSLDTESAARLEAIRFSVNKLSKLSRD